MGPILFVSAVCLAAIALLAYLLRSARDAEASLVDASMRELIDHDHRMMTSLPKAEKRAA